MTLKGVNKRSSPGRASLGEALITPWQGAAHGDLDAVQVFEDGLLIHTNCQQRRHRYTREFVPFASLEDTRLYFQTLYLRMKGHTGVHGVAVSDEHTARELQALCSLGISGALEDLRARAKEARKVYGEETEVCVREITVPSYDPESRREHIVGELPLRKGEPLRLDVAFVTSEIRCRYASVSHYERAMGKRPTFRAYWSLSAEGEDGEAGEAGEDQGGYAELGYRPEDDTFLVKLHNGFEDELSPTAEDYASELLREAAPATVYIESL